MERGPEAEKAVRSQAKPDLDGGRGGGRKEGRLGSILGCRESLARLLGDPEPNSLVRRVLGLPEPDLSLYPCLSQSLCGSNCSPVSSASCG